ncbi:MAG: hypothetical protein ACLQU9_13155 [Acidimicrobiales bacterium]
MPRRDLIPFALVGLLGLLTVLFAVLGASSAPSGATLAVQSASSRTFGSPTGSTSFAMDIVNTLSTGTGTGTVTQVRQVGYVPPDRMAVYQVVGTQTKLLAVLDQAAVTCALSAYTAVVGGTTPWTGNGTTYTRTESLAAYTGRIPRTTSASCAPQATSTQGQVLEKAVINSGYLVGVRVTVVVPAQRLSSGQQVAHGVEGEALVLLQIDGVAVRNLGS